MHPDAADEGITLEQLFAGRNIDIAASQLRMKGLMADEGLPYGERSMTYNSRLAQEVAAWADTKDGAAIHDALFQAYFVNNVNLAIPANLISIVESIGLPADEATTVINDRSFAKVVDEDWQRSRELGITGVPTFVANGRGLVGAQPYEQIAGLLQ